MIAARHAVPSPKCIQALIARVLFLHGVWSGLGLLSICPFLQPWRKTSVKSQGRSNHKCMCVWMCQSVCIVYSNFMPDIYTFLSCLFSCFTMVPHRHVAFLYPSYISCCLSLDFLCVAFKSVCPKQRSVTFYHFSVRSASFSLCFIFYSHE